MIEIRQCTIADLPYIYEICWKTSFRGSSIEEYFTDKFKTGHYFAAPYLHRDPGCCFTVTDNHIPRGYIVGTCDTPAYTEWLNTEWLPKIRVLYDFSSNENLHPVEQFLNKCIADDTVFDPSLTDYPAHLHIDLLPELRGKGLGRSLMDYFFGHCLKKEAAGVHLAVAKGNQNAVAFYRKMGMTVITETENVYTMGIKLNQK